MSFIWPKMLFLFLLLPLLVVSYFAWLRRRRSMAARYGALGILQASGGRPSGTRQQIPPALFLLSFSLLVVALARPQMAIGVPKIEGTVILDFDVSGSMAATDVKPTRMGAAKAAAQAFIQKQPATVQVGVVAFSDSGLAVQPPTNIQADVSGAVKRLTPTRGTSLGNGILQSISVLEGGSGSLSATGGNPTASPAPTPTAVPKGSYKSAVIVLLSDGENTTRPDPLAAAQVAASRGIRIYTVGVGTTSGIDLHVNGFTVHTQMDEATLKQIAQITGGTYYSPQDAAQLADVYQQLDPKLTVKQEETEITSLLAGAGLLVLMVGGVLSVLWFGRLP